MPPAILLTHFRSKQASGVAWGIQNNPFIKSALPLFPLAFLKFHLVLTTSDFIPVLPTCPNPCGVMFSSRPNRVVFKTPLFTLPHRWGSLSSIHSVHHHLELLWCNLSLGSDVTIKTLYFNSVDVITHTVSTDLVLIIFC